MLEGLIDDRSDVMPKEDGKVEAKEEAVAWAGCKTRHRRSSSPYNTSHQM